VKRGFYRTLQKNKMENLEIKVCLSPFLKNTVENHSNSGSSRPEQVEDRISRLEDKGDIVSKD
jgi:hypothetical protein